jgi:hypothetical protein
MKHSSAFSTTVRQACQGALVIGLLLLAGCATRSERPSITGQPISTTSEATLPELSQAPSETPEQIALKARVGMQERLYRVAAPLLVKNTELCRINARKLLGFTAKNKYSYNPEFASAAASSFGLDERLQIMSVLAGSSAAQTGLRRGDILLAVGDQPLPQGPNAEHLAAVLLGPLMTKPSVRLSLLRNNAMLTTTVPLTLACAFGIELANADNVNAYTDGHRIMLTRGMVEFTRSDTELAYVIAREMAHSALGHPGKLRMSATLGGIIDTLIHVRPDLSSLGGTAGVKPFSKEVDAAADTLSLYMLVRAGYDIDGAVSFWQRLAEQDPATVLNGYTAIHPSTAYRMGVMEKIVPEVKAKKVNNISLFP